MIKLEMNFKCCCSDRFSKIYGKLMRDVKRQIGKKRMNDLTMTMTETVTDQKFYYTKYQKSWNEFLCRNCLIAYNKMRKIDTVKVSQYEIKIEG